MMSERQTDVGEWVEIVEPFTKRHLFANLETGDCSPTVPPGAKIKKYSDECDQWWELFDKDTKRFYYYNVSSQTTVWRRPTKGDVIPMTRLQAFRQNAVMTEEEEDAEKTPTDPVRRDHRRTASARFVRDTSASGAPSQRSRRNQSQRMAKGDRWTGCPDHATATDVLNRCDEQNNSKPRISRSEKRDEPQHWLSRSFEKSDGYDLSSSASHDRYSSDVSHGIKPLCTERIPSATANIRDNSSAVCYRDGQRFRPNYCSNEICSFSNEPTRRMRTGNSSVDSGITADVSCAPYEVSCVSLPNSSSGERHFSCDPVQNSNSAQQIGRDELSQVTSETLELSSRLADVHLTSGPQRQPFPRTNPNFAVGQKAPVQMINPLFGHAPNAVAGFDAASNLPLDSEIRRQKSSSNKQRVDGAVFSQMRSNGDRSDRSGHRILDSAQKSTGGSRRSADSATCDTSFSFHKFPPEAASSSSMSADKTYTSISSASSNEYENGRAALVPGFRPNSSELFHHVTEKPVLTQTVGKQFMVEEDRLEACHRTRRNSEPDYANLQEIAKEKETMVEEHSGKKSNGTGGEFGRTETVRAKAEPVYANERLTGRGCLTHEDRYHLPSSTGSHDSSLGSTGSSTISTPSPKLRTRAAHLARETRHMSLRRKKLADKPASATSRSFVDKSRSLHSELIYQQPTSMTTSSFDPEIDSIVCQVADSLLQRADMEQFLSENLNAHRKGLLGKTVPIGNMLVWTKDAIQKPMIRTDNRVVKKESPDVFKLIQTYMGDRKSRESESCLALELANKGWSIPELRDEIYVQLCRQTTKNPRDESLLSGWELLGICLSFFPPSSKFQSYLEGHICQTQESHDHTEGSQLHAYALSCTRRLEKICQTGAARKPNLDDLERCRKSLLQPSMFGSTLEDIMDLQKDRYPTYHLPWIQVTLSETLINFKGNRMPEGIFRVPGDVDEVNSLREKLDHWMIPSPRTDPHVLASVLKLWYRELYKPLIPDEFYDDCVENFDSPKGAISIVNELPLMHRLVLTYLIKFLQKLASPECSAVTKMDASNLAMVMAPNCLRCRTSDPQLLFENARKEMSFLRTLIQNLDTGTVDYAK